MKPLVSINRGSERSGKKGEDFVFSGEQFEKIGAFCARKVEGWGCCMSRELIGICL